MGTLTRPFVEDPLSRVEVERIGLEPPRMVDTLISLEMKSVTLIPLTPPKTQSCLISPVMPGQYRFIRRLTTGEMLLAQSQ